MSENHLIEAKEIRIAYAALLDRVLNYDTVKHPIPQIKINQLIELQEKASLLDLIELNNFRVDIGGKS